MDCPTVTIEGVIGVIVVGGLCVFFTRLYYKKYKKRFADEIDKVEDALKRGVAPAKKAIEDIKRKVKK